jgi:transcriptional regulator with XRE-family HTH domain
MEFLIKIREAAKIYGINRLARETGISKSHISRFAKGANINSNKLPIIQKVLSAANLL